MNKIKVKSFGIDQLSIQVTKAESGLYGTITHLINTEGQIQAPTLLHIEKQTDTPLPEFAAP